MLKIITSALGAT